MRSVFIGTSEYGVPALKKLVECGLSPLLVVSQPERPAGRNLKPQPQALAVAARELGLPLATPANINSPESISLIGATKPEILVTASYGGMLGRQLRMLAPLRAINLHPSLLPRYRGATPIQSAIMNGDTVTGTSIFRMVAALDAGPLAMQEKLEVLPFENHGSLHDRLSIQAADMLSLLFTKPTPWEFYPQDESQACWCQKLNSADLEINWQLPAGQVVNMIRALAPFPGACSYINGIQLKILEANTLHVPISSPPGTLGEIIKNTGFTINCQDHPILVKQVQAAGKKVLSAAAFINGARISAGQTLGKG